MKILKVSLLILFAIGLTQCTPPGKQPDAKSQEKNNIDTLEESSNGDTPESTLPTEKTKPGPDGVYRGEGNYLRLTGTIGDAAVTVHLVIYESVPSVQEGGTEVRYQGFYYYDKYQEPIYLDSPIGQQAGEEITLYEDFWYDLEIVWKLRKQGDRYIGAWYDDAGDKRKADIELRATYSENDPQLGVYWLSDRTLLGGSAAANDEIWSLTQLHMLFPKSFGSGKKDTDNQMNAIWRIVPYFAGEEAAELFHSAGTLLNDIYESHISYAKAEFKELNENDLDPRHEFATRYMSVVHEGDKHLSLLVERHDNQSPLFQKGMKQFINISLSDWDEVTLKDVLNPGYEKTLKNVLLQSAKRKFAKYPSWELDPNAVKITDNYALTDKGIWFSFGPNHFNPYDKMEHQVFASFKSLGNYVKEEWR